MAFHTEVLSTQGADANEWRDLVNRIKKKDVHFTPEYAMLFERTEGKVREYYGSEAQLFFYGNDKNYIIHPILKKRINELPFYRGDTELYDIASPWYYGGPLAFITNRNVEKELFKGFFEELHNYCKQNNIVTEFVRLHPLIQNHLPLVEFVKVEKRWKIVYVNLMQDEKTLWNNFKEENQKAIAKAQKSNIDVIATKKKDDIEKFYMLYINAMRRVHASEHYFFSRYFIESIFELLKNNAQLFIAKYRDKTIAGSLLLGTGEFAHDYLRAADSEFLSMRPNNLLVYTKILWAKENNYKFFSLQGGQSEDDGIFRFKSTFSNTTADFYTYGKIHDESRYQALCDMRDTYDKSIGKSLIESDYFPKYRR